VEEEAEEYKREVPTDIVDPLELRRRAIAAAGRFRSDVSDLSTNHDKYLEESYKVTVPQDNGKKKK
jgi:hypothetical protein